MSANHKPATALPWEATYGLTRGCVHEKNHPNPTNANAIVGPRDRADVAYIAHSANAYPKLIEALRDALSLSTYVSDRIPVDEAVTEKDENCNDVIDRFDALLRELGEAS